MRPVLDGSDLDHQAPAGRDDPVEHRVPGHAEERQVHAPGRLVEHLGHLAVELVRPHHLRDQVHADGPFGTGGQPAEYGRQRVAGQLVAAHTARRPGLGHGAGQLRARDAAHARLEQRHVQAERSGQRGTHQLRLSIADTAASVLPNRAVRACTQRSRPKARQLVCAVSSPARMSHRSPKKLRW